jgi:valyl-tRNA synthetase
MIMITASGADIYLGKDTFDIGRNFANKLWNASRFLLSNIDQQHTFNSLPPIERFKLEDRWIISRLQKVASSINESLEQFRFNKGLPHLYDFIWKIL